nr:uncharacterized protein CI109_000020 [Kwoniella shandongensis]KAA5531182.1 hypothetical protein CI109_000020 [Kwoniella shandongensis]
MSTASVIPYSAPSLGHSHYRDYSPRPKYDQSREDTNLVREAGGHVSKLLGAAGADREVTSRVAQDLYSQFTTGQSTGEVDSFVRNLRKSNDPGAGQAEDAVSHLANMADRLRKLDSRTNGGVSNAMQDVFGSILQSQMTGASDASQSAVTGPSETSTALGPMRQAPYNQLARNNPSDNSSFSSDGSSNDSTDLSSIDVPQRNLRPFGPPATSTAGPLSQWQGTNSPAQGEWDRGRRFDRLRDQYLTRVNTNQPNFTPFTNTNTQSEQPSMFGGFAKRQGLPLGFMSAMNDTFTIAGMSFDEVRSMQERLMETGEAKGYRVEGQNPDGSTNERTHTEMLTPDGGRMTVETFNRNSSHNGSIAIDFQMSNFSSGPGQFSSNMSSMMGDPSMLSLMA